MKTVISCCLKNSNSTCYWSVEDDDSGDEVREEKKEVDDVHTDSIIIQK